MLKHNALDPQYMIQMQAVNLNTRLGLIYWHKLAAHLSHCPMQGPQAFANTTPPTSLKILAWERRKKKSLQHLIKW